MIIMSTPITDDFVKSLNVGDMLGLNGYIFCGRDAVLPKIVNTDDVGIKNYLKGCCIFHTAVSCAGLGPTSSNKQEIENSMVPLSRMGVKIHLGKGRISRETIMGLNQYNSVFAIVPPITALLVENTITSEVVAYEELGMEAFFRINVSDYPIIIAAAHGRSIFDE